MDKRKKLLFIGEKNSEKEIPELFNIYNIRISNDIEESLTLIEKNLDVYLLILVDEKTALRDDGSALKQIAEKRNGREIPIVVITSDESEEKMLDCIELGVTDLISPNLNIKIAQRRLDNIIASYEINEVHRRVAKDPLTNAYNRQFFMEYMMQRINKNPDKIYDIVCLELESYELLKGRYGVEICEIFMNTMVTSLSAFLSSEVIIGRIDEAHVVFLMPHIPFEFHEKMMQGCINMSEGSPFPFFVINSGVYSIIDHGLTAEEIYRNSLLAIEGIRYRYDLFIAEYDDKIRNRENHLKVLANNMYTALSEKQFQVYYQPKYSTQGDKINGAEALVRWIHPELGFMSPGDFIPLFEKNGFIFELDKYILESVCLDIRKWMDSGIEIVPVSVNISQTDFDQFSIDAIFEEIVDRYDIPHEYIHFEITETADAPDAMKKSIAVSGFRKRGFKVELDDFGAGFSTLSILKNMPVDVMKIDMSLVQNITDPKYKAILEGALFTAIRLNIKVVVEGVENTEQYEALQAMCSGYLEPDIQGYYFSKPLPSENFEEKLKN